MYPLGDQDRVYKLEGVPQPSVGAPLPLVLADDARVLLAYYEEVDVPEWDGTTVMVVDSSSTTDPVALIDFKLPTALVFGPPNDETIHGHPLAERGLTPYGAFEVRPSAWIAGLERMNSVHPHHQPEAYEALRHFVFTFHDSCFECVARSFSVDVFPGPILAILEKMKDKLARQ